MWLWNLVLHSFVCVCLKWTIHEGCWLPCLCILVISMYLQICFIFPLNVNLWRLTATVWTVLGMIVLLVATVWIAVAQLYVTWSVLQVWQVHSLTPQIVPVTVWSTSHTGSSLTATTSSSSRTASTAGSTAGGACLVLPWHIVSSNLFQKRISRPPSTGRLTSLTRTTEVCQFSWLCSSCCCCMHFNCPCQWPGTIELCYGNVFGC